MFSRGSGHPGPELLENRLFLETIRASPERAVTIKLCYNKLIHPAGEIGGPPVSIIDFARWFAFSVSHIASEIVTFIFMPLHLLASHPDCFFGGECCESPSEAIEEKVPLAATRGGFYSGVRFKATHALKACLSFWNFELWDF